MKIQNTDPGFTKYDNQKWEAVKYESGTVIVTTHNKDLSHFLVYGPSIDPEEERDRLRYTYAEDLAKFLNTSARPEWLNKSTAKIEFNYTRMSWDDGSNISCWDGFHTKHPPSDLFNYFIEQVALSYMSDAISSDMDKKCLEFMIEAGKQANEATQAEKHASTMISMNLYGLRKEIDDTTHLGPITNIQVTKEAHPDVVKFLNILGAGLQGKSVPVTGEQFLPKPLTVERLKALKLQVDAFGGLPPLPMPTNLTAKDWDGTNICNEVAEGIVEHSKLTVAKLAEMHQKPKMEIIDADEKLSIS